MIFFREVLVIATVATHFAPRVSANSKLQKICEAPCNFEKLFRIAMSFAGRSRTYIKPLEGCYDGSVVLDFGGLNLANLFSGSVGDLIKVNYTVSEPNGKVVDRFQYELSKKSGCITDAKGLNTVPILLDDCSFGTGLIGVVCNKDNNGTEMVYVVDGPVGDISKKCYASISEKLEQLGIEENPEIKKCMLQ